MMRNISLATVVVLAVLKLVQFSNSSSSFSLDQKFDNDPLNDPLKAFDEYKEGSLQRKYTVLVNQKSEDCYFISGVRLGQTLTVDYVVTYFFWFKINIPLPQYCNDSVI